MRSLLAVSLVVLTGCAPDLCAFVSPCPADTPPSEASRAQCRAQLSTQEGAPCWGEAQTFGACVQSSTVCGADGRTDTALSLARARNQCPSQASEYTACCARAPTSSACASSSTGP